MHVTKPLIDVSASMRNVLETGKGNERAIERLRAVLHAALGLARAEQRQDPNALMFISAFGLHNERTPVVYLQYILCPEYILHFQYIYMFHDPPAIQACHQ